METQPGSEGPSLGSYSHSSRAVALAKLVHHECKQLLQLYRERESFPDLEPDGGRLVRPALCGDGEGSEGEVARIQGALRHCLQLLEAVILKEEQEMGEELQGEFETMRKTVRDRLNHLLHSTGALLQNGENPCLPSPEFQGPDEVEGSGGFASKLWTYRVLLELIHWTDSATQALHVLHSEREGEPQEQEL